MQSLNNFNRFKIEFIRLKMRLFKLIGSLLFLFISSSNLVAQNLPALFFSKNTCSLYIQGKLNNIIKHNSSSINTFFLAPSYCFNNKKSIDFLAILTSQHPDFSKLNPTTLCDSSKIAAQKIEESSFLDSFELIRGSILIENKNIKMLLEDPQSYNLNDTVVNSLLTSNRKMILFDLDQLEFSFDTAHNFNFNFDVSFTESGMFLIDAKTDTSQRIPLTKTMINELQSSGITSFATYINSDFLNEQLKNRTYIYANTADTKLEFVNGRFLNSKGLPIFEFNLKGKINKINLTNTYQLHVQFSADSFLIKKIDIIKLEGQNNLEYQIAKAVISAFSKKYYGMFLPLLTKEAPFNIVNNGTNNNVSINTTFAQYIDNFLILVNTVEVH